MNKLAWCTASVAAAATGTSVCLSALAGWQRGGWLPERLLWIAIGVVLVVSAHLLPAMCRKSSSLVRSIGAVMCIVCMAATCYGHTTFFVLAQQHAGQRRAEAITQPAPVALAGRTLTQIANDRAATVAELAARCMTGCAARRTALKARLDALDVDMAEARRLETQADRVTAQQDRVAARRDAVRVDPVTSRVAALVGAPVARVDLLTGLAFAAALEAVACFCWFLALDGADAPKIRIQVASVLPATAEYQVPGEPVTAAIAGGDEPRSDVAQILEAIGAGQVRATVRDIRQFLGCSQARAAELRKHVARSSPTPNQYVNS